MKCILGNWSHHIAPHERLALSLEPVVNVNTACLSVIRNDVYWLQPLPLTVYGRCDTQVTRVLHISVFSPLFSVIVRRPQFII